MSIEAFRDADALSQLTMCGIAFDIHSIMWWKKLPQPDRDEVFRLSDEQRGKMPTLTGLGVDANQVSARRLRRPNHRSKKRDE